MCSTNLTHTVKCYVSPDTWGEEEVREQTVEGLCQSLLQSGGSMTSVKAASIKMQEKFELSSKHPCHFGSSQGAKRFISLSLQTCRVIFHSPSKTSELPLEPTQDLPPPGTQCLPQGCRARGWAAEGQGDRLPFPQKSKVTLPSPLTDFGSSPTDEICPFLVGAGHGTGSGGARLRGWHQRGLSGAGACAGPLAPGSPQLSRQWEIHTWAAVSCYSFR